MAWTTTITNKIIVDGLLKITVQFSDGVQTFKDRYETRSAQDATWLNDNIYRRVADLEAVVPFSETIGLGVYVPVAPVPIVVDETKLTPREKYAKKLEKFEKLVQAIKKGIIADTNVDFLDLKAWLIANWQLSYFDLF